MNFFSSILHRPNPQIIAEIQSRSGVFFQSARKNFHQFVSFTQKAIEIPEFVLKIPEMGLLFFPLQGNALSLSLAIKEIKTVFQWTKGLIAINGFLNGPHSWKHTVRNLSGLILFTLTTVSLSEKVGLLDASAFKIALTALPIFGVLPFGGLLASGMIGLCAASLLLTLEKHKQIDEHLKKAKDKVQTWSNPSTIDKVKQLNLPETELLDYQTKKQQKWALRLEKFKKTKTVTSQDTLGYGIKISKQIFSVVATLSGYGILGIIGEGLGRLDDVLTCKQFFDKRALRKLNSREEKQVKA